MRRSIFITLTITMVLFGLWNIGQGSWMYLKAELAQHLLEKAWTRTLHGERKVKPWPWADTWPVARMQLPQYEIDLIVLSGASGRTLAFGPGHVSTSAQPGQKGTSILNAHRDTHFAFLQEVQEGDHIMVQQSNGALTSYTIRSIDIVDSRLTTITNDPTETQLVLLTCYPFNALAPGGPLRYVITAQQQKAS